MKFCTKCGAQLVDEAQFCTSCGAACGQSAPQPAAEPEPQPAPVAAKEKKPKKPVKKGKVIAILCAVVLLIGAAVGSYFAIAWYNSPEQQLLRALKAGQYEQALDIFDEDASLKYSENLSDSLKKLIETIKADYIAATIEYANVMMELDTIAEIDIKGLRELITETRDYVEKLNASRTAFSTAEAFFANADYVEAIAQYKQVIQEDSNYATAMSKANKAVTLYRTKVLADAQTYATAENYVNAITLLQSALINLPEDAQVTQQILLYEKAQADQILANALENAAKYAAGKDYLSAISVLDQYTRKHGANAEISVARNTYDEANKALILSTALAEAAQLASGKDYLAAIEVLDEYLIWNGSNTEVSAMRNTYQDTYVDLVLADAAVYGDAGAYTNAIAVLNNALKEFPGNSKLTAQVTAYEKAYQAQQLNDALAKAKAYAVSGDYLSAMHVLNTYSGEYGTNASVVVALNEYTDKYVDAVLANAEGQYNAKDYASAITMLHTGLVNAPGNTKLTARLNAYSDTYVAEVIAKSDALLSEKDYDGAIDVVVEAWQVLPDNAALIAQAEKIENAIPKYLLDVHSPYETNYYTAYNSGNTFTMVGETWSNGFVLGNKYYDSYAIFNVGQQYSLMEFVLGHIDGTSMRDTTFYVYLDGVLYQSYSVDADGMPQTVSIPLSGVSQVKFYVYEGGGERIGLAEIMVS